MSIDEQPMNVYWSGQKSPTSNKYKINYKGTVATASDLPATGNKKGDTYNISEDGSDYVWTGTEWNRFGANVYIGATDTANGIQGLVPPASSSQIYSLLAGGGTWESAEDLGLALDNDVVHKTGNEIIAGSKAFTTAPRFSASNNFISFIESGSSSKYIDFRLKLGGEDSAYVAGSRTQVESQTTPDIGGMVSFNLGVRATGGSSAFYGSNRLELVSGGRVSLIANATGSESGDVALVAKADGTLTWGGQSLQTTSDARLKTPISAVPDEVLDAWGGVGWGQFQYLDAVARKGSAARLHLGLVAQAVKAAFEAHGLDACAYGILCHEEQAAVPAVYGDDGELVSPARDASDVWTVRYAEAQAMEAAYQRRRAERAEARIKALEDRLSALEAKLV